jgi:DNA-binding transcriptional ArsR family regulator
LAAPFAMTQPTISKHLKVLEGAGLVTRGQGTHRRPCRLQARPPRTARPLVRRAAALHSPPPSGTPRKQAVTACSPIPWRGLSEGFDRLDTLLASETDRELDA